MNSCELWPPPSAILRDEVKYVHSDADLLAMEKTARGRTDMVLGYVSSLGTPGTEAAREGPLNPDAGASVLWTAVVM